MAQAPSTPDGRTAQNDPESDLLKEEQFWERYSPHHEFPLSSVIAFAACAVALGLLLVLEILHANRQDELARPPKMDAVEIEGGGGTDGPGVADGSGPRQGSRTEVGDSNPTKAGAVTPPSSTEAPQLKDVANPKPLDVPAQVAKAETGDPSIFDEIRSSAENQVKEAMATPLEKPAPANQGDPRGNPKGGKNYGTGGGQGGGTGTGSGKYKGPGTGHGKTGGVLTQQQKHEMRWKIKFITEDGPEHVEQLRALKITLAIPTHQQGIFSVMDLTRKPPVGRIDNLMQQRDKVKWFNTFPPSLQRLASALRLSQVPQFVVIFLPQEMEDTLARLEHEYRGLPENQITETEFEIRRRPDGTYAPEVTSQR